eukprot:TRINITY_DN653_c0_g2_i1.p1 TRINITY_DN653_c0_g2~~TRINITY_DN653_c0_g2_i1.p1  ORF type:complete len:166 (-),score=29.15 TRINITY_DN653_c0_g2_i1:55-552(-)
MVSAAEPLKVPVIVTEQNPKALGTTVPEIDISKARTFSKMKFSMLEPEVEEYLKSLRGPENEPIKSVVLFGIESHVCVLQTALELLQKGYNVHVLADGVSSRHHYDREAGFSMMRQHGAMITTSESLLFQLLESANHPAFKAVQNLIKLHPASGLPFSSSGISKI